MQSPDCRRKKTELTINTKEYSDNGLSSYTLSSLKTVRNRFYFFCIYDMLVFSRPQPVLFVSWVFEIMFKMLSEVYSALILQIGEKKKQHRSVEHLCHVQYILGLKACLHIVSDLSDYFYLIDKLCFVCLFVWLTYSSTTRLYRGRAPRQSVCHT